MKTTFGNLAAVALVLFSVPAAADGTPGDWLTRMSVAVKTTNYEGTVIRIRDAEIEALRVTHVVADGIVRERVIAQEGNGLEIIRNGDEAHWILPDKKQVLVDKWNDQSTLFSALPSSDIRFGSEYDVSIVGTERVAGRKTVVIAIRPHDDYRFGHRLWLDSETAFPLQTKLIANGGDAIEQVRFADIRISNEIDALALSPTIDTGDFRWFANPGRKIDRTVETSWHSKKLPPGFRPVSTHMETLPGSDVPLVHILYSDGLANVSVFVEPARGKSPSRHSREGLPNGYSTQIRDFQVTAIGEVPMQTVKQIASSMHPVD
jgi:sigma-E factor negative regulatory protein RseB